MTVGFVYLNVSATTAVVSVRLTALNHESIHEPGHSDICSTHDVCVVFADRFVAPVATQIILFRSARVNQHFYDHITRVWKIYVVAFRPVVCVKVSCSLLWSLEISAYEYIIVCVILSSIKLNIAFTITI